MVVVEVVMRAEYVMSAVVLEAVIMGQLMAAGQHASNTQL